MNSIPSIPSLPSFSIPAVSTVAIVLGVILLILFAKPIAKVLKLLLHAVFGFILLFAINYFIPSEIVHLDIDLANCIVAGIGGIPGVILLLLYQYFLA